MTSLTYAILFLLLAVGGIPAAHLALLYLGRGRRRQLAEVPPPGALVAARALPAHPYRESGRPIMAPPGDPSPPSKQGDADGYSPAIEEDLDERLVKWIDWLRQTRQSPSGVREMRVHRYESTKSLSSTDITFITAKNGERRDVSSSQLARTIIAWAEARRSRSHIAAFRVDVVGEFRDSYLVFPFCLRPLDHDEKPPVSVTSTAAAPKVDDVIGPIERGDVEVSALPSVASEASEFEILGIDDSLRQIMGRKAPSVSRLAITPPRETFLAFAVSAEHPGETKTITQPIYTKRVEIRDFWATDWTTSMAEMDPAYATQCLDIVTNVAASSDPPQPRELWVTDEPPVEAPANLDIDAADTLTYLRAVKARDERKVIARVYPAPGTNTTITGIFLGADLVIRDPIPTVAAGNWISLVCHRQPALQLSVGVKFKQPGTFVIVFRGHKVDQPAHAYAPIHVFGQEGTS